MSWFAKFFLGSIVFLCGVMGIVQTTGKPIDLPAPDLLQAGFVLNPKYWDIKISLPVNLPQAVNRNSWTGTSETGGKIAGLPVHYPTWPVYVTAEFHAAMDYGKHQGLDLRCVFKRGWSEIHAAADGRVTYVGHVLGGGDHAIIIAHGNGFTTEYLHNREALVKAGDVVMGGQPIAKCGAEGHADGPHLHLAVRQNGVIVNPTGFIFP